MFYLDFDNPDDDYDRKRLVPLCAACPVHQECFEHALEYEDDGWYAGTTPGERRALRRVAKVALKKPGT